MSQSPEVTTDCQNPLTVLDEILKTRLIYLLVSPAPHTILKLHNWATTVSFTTCLSALNGAIIARGNIMVLGAKNVLPGDKTTADYDL